MVLPHKMHPQRPPVLNCESDPIGRVAFWWECHHKRVTTYNKQNNDSQCTIQQQEHKNKQNG
jgi:hypothetical protein